MDPIIGASLISGGFGIMNGLGSLFGSNRGYEQAQAMQAMQHHYNQELMAQQNKYNQQAQQLQNQITQSLFSRAQDYNSEEANKANERNRQNQEDAMLLTRRGLLKAGLNVNFLNGASAVGASSPSAVSPGGSAPSPVGVSGSSVGTPSINNPLFGMNLLQNAELSEKIANMHADTEGKQEDNKSKRTFNKYYGEVLSQGLVKTKAEAQKLYQDVQESKERILQYQANVKQLNQLTANLSQDEVYKKIQNGKAEGLFDAQIADLKSKAHWNDKMIDYYFAKLPSEIFLNKANGSNAYANARLADAKKDLTEHEVKQVDQLTQYYKMNTETGDFELSLSREFAHGEREANLRKSNAEAQGAEYDNSETVKMIGTGLQVLDGVANTVSAVKGFSFAPYTSKSSSRSRVESKSRSFSESVNTSYLHRGE